jgi:hypothetical protein
MKEYTKEFNGVTYTFTEDDLSEPFSYALSRLKESIEDGKVRMGSRYTEEVDNKVQSLIEGYIVSSFEIQVDTMNYTLEWSKDITPKFAMHHATSIGEFANRHIKACNVLINRVADDLIKIGVPVCKQII